MSRSSRRRSVLRSASFRAWLLARRSQVVGQSGCEDACPIANWLSSLFSAPCEVDCTGYVRGDSSTVHPVPSWVQAYIRAIDFACPFDEVTGEQALQLLDLVEREALGNGPARPLLSPLIPFDGGQHTRPIAGVLL